MDLATWALEHAEKISVVFLLIMAVLSYGLGWIVPKRTYDKAISDCDYHRQAHMRLLEQLERTVSAGQIISSVAQTLSQK
jgi:uncharacterized ion transporter superfamily protein YfcC